MHSQVLFPSESTIQHAAKLLRNGQLVAFPTETVYGLGANALNVEAVKRIFDVKGRPSNNPLIVHVADISAARPFCHINKEAKMLMDAFCPGPLTLLLPKTERIPSEVNAGLASVAIRIPNHPVALSLLKACKVPIAAPSANSSGRPSPTTSAHVLQDLGDKISLILEGGACEVGLESTVLDMTGKVPTVLRPGGITPNMLRSVLPEVCVADSVLRPLHEGEAALSPGMLYKHYAPKGKLLLVKGTPENVRTRCLFLYEQARHAGIASCILAFDEHISLYANARVISIGALAQPETIAKQLFSALRSLDEQCVALTVCEVMPPHEMGLAVMNRLHRAAAFQVIDADKPPTNQQA